MKELPAMDPAAMSEPTRDAQIGRRRIDVCNGDADGLCAVVQWRLHEPAQAELVTGLKRQIALLDRVVAGVGDEVLVCDISMARNRSGLERLLAAGARVRYFDHHAAGEVPVHPGLEVHLDFASDVCTSLLMDRHLGGRFRAWAAVGAYGDNLRPVGDRLAAAIGLDSAQRDALRRLGEAINYNAYGETEADLLIPPARLYTLLSRYRDPLEFARHEPVAREIDEQRRADLAQAAVLEPYQQCAGGSVYLLPDASWARRVTGSLANELAFAQPRRAHALLRQSGSDFVVSVRAPLASPAGANELCTRFGGMGRAAAGGIDRLPQFEFERFVQAFEAADWGAAMRC